MDTKQRQALIAFIWKKTHRDFRGGNGAERTIMKLVPGRGTCLVYLEKMTDAELEAHMKDMRWTLPTASLL